jgi:metal-sulfur cluster biosynthetic enzyme
MLEVSGDPAITEEIQKELRMVYDPEIPVNILDLGLIYKIDFDEEKVANITMTFTSPACPIAGQILNEVNERTGYVDGVEDVRIEVSWNPPWNKDMATERAQIELSQIFDDFR